LPPNVPASPFARRVSLYALAALPASTPLTSYGLCADECFGYALDRVQTRDSAEALRVEAALARSERSDGPTTVREWAVSL
jgi:hypothetical protein